MKRSHGLRGIHQLPSGRWRAQVRINGRKQTLGCFGTKEEAAAAYDSAARLNHGVNAVCNYGSEEEHTAREIYEAREINLLSSTGCLRPIWEACGHAKYEEALRQLHAMVIGEHAIWRKEVAAVNLRKAEKTAATERPTERAAVMESERAAVVAERADWDATYNTANPVGLYAPASESHGEPRACAGSGHWQAQEQALGGHNIGLVPELLDDVMKEIKAAIVEHIGKYSPDWSKKAGGGSLRPRHWQLHF
jgi:hypothetical protein